MTAQYRGTGRRKTATAQVILSPGEGNAIINGRTAEEYLQGDKSSLTAIYAPLECLGLDKLYNVTIRSMGGGIRGQVEAIQLAIARAIASSNTLTRRPLKTEGFLTVNAACKERKKYGLKKARRAPQFSKR